MSFKIYLEEDKFIEYKDEGSILECLEENGMTCDYSCRGGFCGICAVTKISGQVNYNLEPIYEVGNDEILACCCLPSSDITINTKSGQSLY